MISLTRAETVELISRIQSGESDGEGLQALERATGNPNVRVIFEVLELDGMMPEKIFDLICGNSEIHASCLNPDSSLRSIA